MSSFKQMTLCIGQCEGHHDNTFMKMLSDFASYACTYHHISRKEENPDKYLSYKFLHEKNSSPLNCHSDL